jgi:hypothetical protein
MKSFVKAAALAVLGLSVGCAQTTGSNPPSGTPDTPVGTMGTVGPAQVGGTQPGRIPVGQQFDVRLQDPLSSKTATPEQRFDTTTAVDLMQGDTILVPAGSMVRGVVKAVEKAGRIDREGELTLAFDQMVIDGREYAMRALATQVYESGGIREEMKTIGTAGAVGAIVGGLIGGLKGVLIGAAVGTGGVIAATEGKDIELPAGTIIRIRLDTPVQIK